MPKQQQTFNQSIRYMLPLIKNKRFKRSLYFLASRLTNTKNIRENHVNPDTGKHFNENLTIFRSLSTCLKSYTNSTKGEKDYHLYNLTRADTIRASRTYSTNTRRYTRFYAIAFLFENRYDAKNVIKDLHIKRENILFSSFIGKTGKYQVVVRFSDGITQKQGEYIFNLLYMYHEQNQHRYKPFLITPEIAIPSSIFDRWYNIFDGKILYKTKDIVESFRNSINVRYLIANLHVVLKRDRGSRTASRVRYFISNQQRLPMHVIRENIYVVNHYINDKNPYKRKDARKDWKFAAEQYLNEVIGKYRYLLQQFNQEIADAEEYAKQNSTEYKCLLNSLEGRKEIHQGELSQHRYLCNLRDTDPKTWKSYSDWNMYSTDDNKPNDSLLREISFLETKLSFYEMDLESYDRQIREAIEKSKNKRIEYLNNKRDEYLSLFFSKKEVNAFVEKLNLKTKISGVKLRKIVIDEFVKLGLLKEIVKCKVKISCRKFLLDFNKLKNMYLSINKKIIYYFNIIYNLKDSLAKFREFVEKTDLNVAYNGVIHDPPS